MQIDIQSWSMREVAELESLSGQSVQTIGDTDTPKARVLTAMAFIHLRRSDPKFKYGQAEAMTLEEISDVLGMGTDDEDTGPDDEDEPNEDDEDPKD